MTTLPKDEVLRRAREAGFSVEFAEAALEKFEANSTLCRAPLVAENAALKEQLKALGVYNESTKVELARVQAVAEWQGSADGGKIWRRIDKPRGESIESRVAHLRNMTNWQGRPIYLIRALYTLPQPAAQEPTSAVPVVEQFLQDGDQHLLHSFIETTEDDEGYMLTKPEIKRLAELGVVQSHGFGKYSVTMFGHWVHERYWHQNPSLPLKTNTDRTADAAIAAGQKFIKENGK